MSARARCRRRSPLPLTDVLPLVLVRRQVPYAQRQRDCAHDDTGEDPRSIEGAHTTPGVRPGQARRVHGVVEVSDETEKGGRRGLEGSESPQIRVLGRGKRPPHFTEKTTCPSRNAL